MRKYTLTAAAAMNHVPENPERTARRNATGHMNFDVVFQVWTNRAAMARTIRMQENAGTPNAWRACVPLGLAEGY